MVPEMTDAMRLQARPAEKLGRTSRTATTTTHGWHLAGRAGLVDRQVLDMMAGTTIRWWLRVSPAVEAE